MVWWVGRVAVVEVSSWQSAGFRVWACCVGAGGDFFVMPARIVRGQRDSHRMSQRLSPFASPLLTARPRPSMRMCGPFVTVNKHHETTEVAEYFAAFLLKGAEAFGHQSADQSEQHSTMLVGTIAEVAFGENVLGGWKS